MTEEEKKEQQKQQNKGTSNQDNTDKNDEKDNQNNQDESNTDKANNDAQKNNADNTQSLPKTQAELDNIIKSRLAREQKKQGGTNTNAGSEQTTEEDTSTNTDNTDTVTTESVSPNNDVMKQLVKANAQIAAYKAGILPDLVEDAVALAIYEASELGEPTADNISVALENVLKRHPDWKPTKDDKETQKGFKVGTEGKGEDGENNKKTYSRGMTII